MSKKSTRVGVRYDQVDAYGRVNPRLPLIDDLASFLPYHTELNVYKDGTEQLLPVNTSEPTTSPILADIRYPTGIWRNGQYFTYRESPTEATGKARIKSIRGNTLCWNQLRSPIVGSSTPSGITGTFTADGKCVFTGTSTGANVFVLGSNIPMRVNHKYLILFNKTLDANRNIQLRYSADGTTDSGGYLASIYNSTIFTYTNSIYPYALLRFYFDNGVTLNDTFYISVYDLTMIFGSGNEPTLDEFRSLFPLDYYAYNSGSLLNFNGTGIKTTGKNLLDSTNLVNELGTAWDGSERTIQGVKWRAYFNDEGFVTKIVADGTSNNSQVGINFTLPRSGNYYFGLMQPKVAGTVANVYMWDLDTNARPKNWTGTANAGNCASLSPTGFKDEGHRLRIQFRVQGTVSNLEFYPCVFFADETDWSFEPYTTSTTSLPVSTYFPTGMKSAGSVYDELSDKAITRVLETVVDGTNKVASYYGMFEGHQLFYIDLFSNTSASAEFAMCLLSNKYTTYDVATMPDKGIRYQGVPAQTINIGRVYWTDDSYTSASAMNTALQSSPLVINSVLATYTEESTLNLGE